MSFPSVDSNSSNTELDAFTSSCETLGPDYFDEYLAHNSTIKVEHRYPDLSDSNLFRCISNSGFTDVSSCVLDDDIKLPTQKRDADQDLWNPSNSVSQRNSIYPQSLGKAAVSESELLNLGTINLNSPQTPTHFQQPALQSPYDTATFLRRPGGIADTPSEGSRNSYAGLRRNSIRKTSSCPKMMRTFRRSNSDLWAASIEAPRQGVNSYGQASTIPFMSPQSFATPERSAIRGFAQTVSYTNDINHDCSPGLFDFETPFSTPISERQSIIRVEEEPQLLDMSLTPKPNYAEGEWCQMSVSSGLPVSKMLSVYSPDQDSPLWWNAATSAPIAQPSPAPLHVSPQATESIATRLHNKISHTCNGLPYRPSNMTLDSDHLSGDIFPIDESVAQQFNTKQSCPQYISQPKQSNVIDQSPQHPRLLRKPRFGPDGLDPPPPIPSPELQVRKCKTSAKRPKQAKASLEGIPASPSAGFVNYTPDDSMKILTGVAPSGSSKTKARREKEALEKRRKLSQAAVRAVKAAGGDVTVLAEEGLLV